MKSIFFFLSIFAINTELVAMETNPSPKNILVVGKTGSGKSSFINWLVEKKLCPTSTGGQICTKELQIVELPHVDSQEEKIALHLIDTPGIGEGPSLERELQEKIIFYIARNPICAVILVINADRLCHGTHQMMSFYKSLFEPLQKKGQIVVLRRLTADDVDDKELTTSYMEKRRVDWLENAGLSKGEFFWVDSLYKKTKNKPLEENTYFYDIAAENHIKNQAQESAPDLETYYSVVRKKLVGKFLISSSFDYEKYLFPLLPEMTDERFRQIDAGFRLFKIEISVMLRYGKEEHANLVKQITTNLETLKTFVSRREEALRIIEGPVDDTMEITRKIEQLIDETKKLSAKLLVLQFEQQNDKDFAGKAITKEEHIDGVQRARQSINHLVIFFSGSFSIEDYVYVANLLDKKA